MPIKYGSNLRGGDVAPVRATQDATVTQIIEHGVEIQRKVFAGEMVPPDLVDAYADATGDRVSSADTSVDYDAMNVDQLEAEIAERDDIDLDSIDGTGKDGKVVKADLVKALRNA